MHNAGDEGAPGFSEGPAADVLLGVPAPVHGRETVVALVLKRPNSCRHVQALAEIRLCAMQAVKEHLASVKGRLRPFRSVSLRLSTGDETVVAPALERLSTQFEGSVGIGSYPVRRRHPKGAMASAVCLAQGLCSSEDCRLSPRERSTRVALFA